MGIKIIFGFRIFIMPKFFFLLLIFLCSCQGNAKRGKNADKLIEPDAMFRMVLAKKHKKLENFDFDPGASLAERIRPVPEFLLETLRIWNKKRDQYNYNPGPGELKLIENYLGMLPDKIKDVLRQRLVAIYFVKNFVGGGFTNWLVDKENRIYCYIVLPARLFSLEMDQWLTYKESLHFIEAWGFESDYSVRIVTGRGLKAIYYGLLHEIAHVLDYSLHVTPYLWPDLQKLNPAFDGKSKDNPQTGFTRNVWKSFYNPTRENNFYYRKYFILTGSGRYMGLELEEAVNVYKELENTAFVSLYSTKSWAEDFAEFFTFYHLTQVLKKPYFYQVKKKSKVIYNYSPMTSSKVRNRFKYLEPFFK